MNEHNFNEGLQNSAKRVERERDDYAHNNFNPLGVTQGGAIGIQGNIPPLIRQFETGATRNTDADRYDPEGFLSPIVIERYCEYMNKNRRQADGTVRASDNWQKGIPQNTYMKGMWRHFLHLWTRFRGYKVNDAKAALDMEEDCCALMFGSMGLLFELLRDKQRLGVDNAASGQAK